MTKSTPLHSVARLPAPTDNCAVAMQILPAGTNISHNSTTFTLSHTILEGHRFAAEPIAAGQPLLSWGATFGMAQTPIALGDYVCNAKVLKELHSRNLDFDLPSVPNFSDDLDDYQFDPQSFKPAAPLPPLNTDQTFLGYPRPGGRGVGTRNDIVILAVSSRVSSFVTQLAQMLKSSLKSPSPQPSPSREREQTPFSLEGEGGPQGADEGESSQYPNIDDIVAVAHTEGSYAGGNNQELLLRTLTGFMVHPNVGAVLCVDGGSQGVTNAILKKYAAEHDVPLAHVPHAFMSLDRSFGQSLAAGVRTVQGWLDQVNSVPRSLQPVSALKIALQCGGSDAFSGISGNPLAAWVAKQVIRAGGSAVLAETDELNGAEAYVLDKVSSRATAEKFLMMLDRFEAQVNSLGKSGIGNPSGGNLYRGLYNIYLKSLGAATKRDPEVSVDYAIDYSQPLSSPGYYFMDSPGNDLESIAGQVASGCNMIFFVTGNGSITNFPFVPTVKIVTTTERFTLLEDDMDINAGGYLDGTPLPELGAQTLDYTLAIASGQRSVGERAGHAQVQIWRDWANPADPAQAGGAKPSGRPIKLTPADNLPDFSAEFWSQNGTMRTDRVGLILPTSLCSGQIAQIAVSQLNEQAAGQPNWPTRFVTLVHTEGCGATIQPEFEQTMLGYLKHPMVTQCVLLEHGCESTHNSYWRQKMIQAGYATDDYGWASVQLDGGIEQSISKLTNWFTSQNNSQGAPTRQTAGLQALQIAILSDGSVADQTAAKLRQLANAIASAGGTAVLLENDFVTQSHLFRDGAQAAENLRPTLGFSQPWDEAGLHVMGSPTRQWAENLAGVCATGVELVLAVSGHAPQAGHPLVPVLNITANGATHGRFEQDYDLLWEPSAGLEPLLRLISQTISGQTVARAVESNNLAFQITRGLTGVSL